ncbi:MAG: hypothetical protein Q9219_007098 [cf. Caloplaca sp. 3 TL-2023]
MASGDFGGYKRIVQYFWDPEPKNDDPARPPIWCLVNGNSDPPTELHRGLEEDGGWPSLFMDDFESRIWFTYRFGFPVIRRPDGPNAASSINFAVRLRSQLVDQGGLSSDTGWGCMIRSGQSLLANTLVNLRLGRGAIRPFSLKNQVLTTPQVGEGVHNSRKKDDYSAFSLMIRMLRSPFTDLSSMVLWHVASTLVSGLGHPPQQGAFTQDSLTVELKVYMNGDGADVYEDRFFSLAIAEDGQFTPTLILVGIRLGIDRITSAYWQALRASLQLPQSVGIAGGRPSSSHYFVGVQGDQFFFLDPHQSRAALPRRGDIMEYRQEEIDSCHTRRLRRLPIQDMDPSMLIGFLIRNKSDWYEWRRRMTEVHGKPVVHVADKEPSLESGIALGQNAMFDITTLDDDEDIETI